MTGQGIGIGLHLTRMMLMGGAAPATPVLSDPNAIATGVSQALASVTTDQPQGTLTALVSARAGTPSQAQLMAGQDSGGDPAQYTLTHSISAAGGHSFTATGLVPATFYNAHFIYTDQMLGSDTVSSAMFRTHDDAAIRVFDDGDASFPDHTILRSGMDASTTLDCYGRPHAIAFTNTGAQINLVRAALLTFPEVFVFSVRLKSVAATTDRWARIRTILTVPSFEMRVNITDDGTPDANRIGMLVGPVSEASVSGLGDGWFEVRFTVDFSTEPSDPPQDLTGEVRFEFGDSATSSRFPASATAGSEVIAIHDLFMAGPLTSSAQLTSTS